MKMIMVIVCTVLIGLNFSVGVYAHEEAGIETEATAAAKAKAGAIAGGGMGMGIGDVKIEGSKAIQGPMVPPYNLPRYDQPYYGPYPGFNGKPFQMNDANSLQKTKEVWTIEDIQRNLSYKDNSKKAGNIITDYQIEGSLPPKKAEHFHLLSGYTAEQIRTGFVKEEMIKVPQKYTDGEVVIKDGKPVMVEVKKVTKRKFEPFVVGTFFTSDETDIKSQSLQNHLGMRALDDNRKEFGGQYIFIVEETFENWSQTTGANVGGNAAGGLSSSSGLQQTTISLPFFTYSKSKYVPKTKIAKQIIICYGEENGKQTTWEEVIEPPRIERVTVEDIKPSCNPVPIQKQIESQEAIPCPEFIYVNVERNLRIADLDIELYKCTGEKKYLYDSYVERPGVKYDGALGHFRRAEESYNVIVTGKKKSGKKLTRDEAIDHNSYENDLTYRRHVDDLMASGYRKWLATEYKLGGAASRDRLYLEKHDRMKKLGITSLPNDLVIEGGKP